MKTSLFIVILLCICQTLGDTNCKQLGKTDCLNNTQECSWVNVTPTCNENQCSQSEIEADCNKDICRFIGKSSCQQEKAYCINDYDNCKPQCLKTTTKSCIPTNYFASKCQSLTGKDGLCINFSGCQYNALETYSCQYNYNEQKKCPVNVTDKSQCTTPCTLKVKCIDKCNSFQYNQCSGNCKWDGSLQLCVSRQPCSTNILDDSDCNKLPNQYCESQYSCNGGQTDSFYTNYCKSIDKNSCTLSLTSSFCNWGQDTECIPSGEYCAQNLNDEDICKANIQADTRCQQTIIKQCINPEESCNIKNKDDCTPNLCKWTSACSCSQKEGKCSTKSIDGTFSLILSINLLFIFSIFI